MAVVVVKVPAVTSDPRDETEISEKGKFGLDLERRTANAWDRSKQQPGLVL